MPTSSNPDPSRAPAAGGCPRCDAGDHGRERREDGLRHRPTVPAPSVGQAMEWLDEGGAEATDGCWVEPEGTCEHGHSSWLIGMGLI